MTEWDEFRGLDLDRFASTMRGKLIVDLRNVYNRADAEEAGFDYVGLGRGRIGGGAPPQAGQQRSRSGSALSRSSVEPRSQIVVVGLGYVGLPLAVALARKFEVIGLDRDCERIAELREGTDRTREVERRRASGLVAAAHGPTPRNAAEPTSTSSPCRRLSMRTTIPTLAAVLSATRTIAGLIDPSAPPDDRL